MSRGLTKAFTVGLSRGGLELAQTLRTPREAFSLLSTPLMFVVLSLAIEKDIAGSDVPMSHLLMAGGITTMLVQTGLMTLPQVLATEREDGTLLRLKTVPGGITSYLVGKTVVVLVTALGGALLTLLAGALFAGTDLPRDAAHWLTLTWVLLLGLVAVVPLGAAIGALLPNPREALGFTMIPIFFLMGCSGLFFPVTTLPDGARAVVEVFPVKWIAQGVRSALLPDSALAAETGQSWQHAEILMIVGAWAVVGFLLAPRLLRRMTRRESGSRLKKAEA
ncbi:ABC transporter permease [Streptomyces cyaneus]|uniref:ABC transporter permease n=1 Tax=Streptomyces cyaneus TaxID=1904 RepID=UPI0015E89163|nr:ABC transporter permease [Streptomyces cyaneus]